jgi:hypothetical protein
MDENPWWTEYLLVRGIYEINRMAKKGFTYTAVIEPGAAGHSGPTILMQRMHWDDSGSE